MIQKVGIHPDQFTKIHFHKHCHVVPEHPPCSVGNKTAKSSEVCCSRRRQSFREALRKPSKIHLANIGSPQAAQLGPRLPYATGRAASPGEGAREGLLDPQHPHTTQGCKHWSWISWNPSKAHSRVCFRKSYGNSFPAHSHPQEGKWRIFLLEETLNLSVTYPLAWDPHSLLLWMSCSIFSALDIQYRTCKDNQMFPYPSLDKYQVLRQIHWIYWVLSNKNISENKNTERCFHKIVIFNLYQTPPPHFRSVSVLSY